MKKYPKIQTLFKRCTENGPNKNKLIEGDWTLPEFEALKDLEWEATEKVDGTNISVHWGDDKVEFFGRDENAQIPARLVNWLIGVFTVERFRDLGLPEMTIFGEGYGDGIQKIGKDYCEPGVVSFAAFDIWCGDLWLEARNMQEVAGSIGVSCVQQHEPLTLHRAIDVVRRGFDSSITKPRSKDRAQAEGLVLRAPHGLLNRRGERIICKIKTKDFTRGMVTKAEDVK